MIWYSCVGSGTPKYTTTMQALNDRDGSLQPPDLQPSKSLHPPPSGCNQATTSTLLRFGSLQTINHHQSNAPNGSSCWICFIPMDPLIVEETSVRPFKTSHEGFFRLQSEPINSFGKVRQKSFHSPASGKGPALVIGLPAHHLRFKKNQQDRFFRESVSPWQLSGVVPIIYLESCILPPPHSVNSDKGFF